MNSLNERHNAILKKLEENIKEAERLNGLTETPEHAKMLKDVIERQELLLDRLEKLNEK